MLIFELLDQYESICQKILSELKASGQTPALLHDGTEREIPVRWAMRIRMHINGLFHTGAAILGKNHTFQGYSPGLYYIVKIYVF